MYRLVFLTGRHKGRRLAVQKGDLVFGRDPDCHVQLHDPAAAMQHAILEQRPDGCFIKALAPSTFINVNGDDANETRLQHGDEIGMAGDRFLFQFMQSDGAWQKRRSGKFHGLTFMAVAIILLLQIVILAGVFLFWRLDPIHVPEKEEEAGAALADTTDEEEQLLERLRARTAQTEADGVSAFAVKPFQLVPERLVTPEFRLDQGQDSSVPLDEGGAADSLLSDEE